MSPVLFLLLIVKREEGKNKWKEEIVNKREPGFYILGNSQPIQIVKDAKLEDLLSGRCNLERKLRTWLDTLLLSPQKE